MNEEVNEFLEQNLSDAHNCFKVIINEMKEHNIPYNYSYIEEMEENSFKIVRDNINQMRSKLYEYTNIVESNGELFNYKYSLYLKYAALYMVSLAFIKLYHEIIGTDEFNEMWNYVLGLFFGSTFMGLLNKDIKDYQSDTKENREIINQCKTLKEEYQNIHDQSVIEIDYMFALNRRLWHEYDTGKRLVK